MGCRSRGQGCDACSRCRRVRGVRDGSRQAGNGRREGNVLGGQLLSSVRLRILEPEICRIAAAKSLHSPRSPSACTCTRWALSLSPSRARSKMGMGVEVEGGPVRDSDKTKVHLRVSSPCVRLSELCSIPPLLQTTTRAEKPCFGNLASPAATGRAAQSLCVLLSVALLLFTTPRRSRAFSASQFDVSVEGESRLRRRSRPSLGRDCERC